MMQRLLILLLLAGQVHAQQLVESNFAHYTTAKGLSHNTITGLAQDATGYIWITTPTGINRFNGSQFVQFHSSSDSLSLASEDISGAAWLNKEELGIYTTGLHIVNTRTGKTRNIYIPYHRKQFQYKFNMMVRAMGDSNGNVYILTRSGFYHYDKKDQLVSRFDYYAEKEVPITHFFFGRELLVLDRNRLLIVSIDGLFLYDKTLKKVKRMTADDSALMAEFLDYPKSYYVFFQQKPGHLLVFKSQADSVTYINVESNKKVASRIPINPVIKEIHYFSRLLPVHDTLLYITAQSGGFFKAKFDPSTCKVYLNPEKYFPTYQVNALAVGKDNNLWVGTNKGLFRQDESLSLVRTAFVPKEVESIFPNVTIQEVFVNGKTVFAGTRNMGTVLLFDKNTMEFNSYVSFEHFRKMSRKTYNVYSMVEADHNTLVLATDGPPFLVNKNGTNPRFLVPPEWNMEGNWAGELFKDSKGKIWISSIKVYQYDHANKSFSFIPWQEQEVSQIVIPEVIREDSAGNIWMAGHGLSRYNTSTKRFDLRLDSFPFIKMPDKQVSTMLIDKNRNTIWFNSRNNGLISYDISNKSYRHFTTAQGLSDNNIASLIIVGDKLWIAGYTGIACMNMNTGKITGFGKEDGLPDMPILNRANFYYDSVNRHLYLAYSQAIARFNPDQLLRKKMPPDVFVENIAIGDKPLHFLPSNNITTSWKNNEVRITIGSINFRDAASQRYAYRIAKDSGTPWTEMGSQPSFTISNLAPGKHRIEVKTYSLSNRWPEQVKALQIEVLPPLWMKSWFQYILVALGMVLFYLFIHWRTTRARKKEMVKTHIEKLKADDYKSQFELEQISNYFSSSLANKKAADDVLWDVASNLIGRMNYEDCIIYMWNKDKTKMVQKAAYGPKGKPGVISETAFTVEPGQGIVGHVIQTSQPLLVNDTRLDSRYRVDDEFRCSEIAVPIIHDGELLGVIDSENGKPGYFSERDIKILTTIATLISNKLKQIESEHTLEAKKKELAGINEQLAEARLSALQAQMNPHFVFNALNSIKRMILDCQNEKASRYLSKFALMIRMTLEHSKEVFVTLDDNIEYLKAYLDMEKLRFDDTFTYSIDTEEHVDTTETVMPSMMIQPLVENAIWHGLMQATTDKRIRITFSQQQNKITCTVEDNGIGIKESERQREKHRSLHKSIGLENLRKRIKIMNEKYNTACSLQIMDLEEVGKNGTGTRAVLQINLITT